MDADDPIPALKVQLAREVAAMLEGWNVDDIAFHIGTDRSRVADLLSGRLARFSLETLIRFATRLNRRVVLATTRGPLPFNF